MNELNKAGYYLTESGNLLILYPENNSLTKVEMFANLLKDGSCWINCLWTQKELGLMNKTLEFEYIGCL